MLQLVPEKNYLKLSGCSRLGTAISLQAEGIEKERRHGYFAVRPSSSNLSLSSQGVIL